MKFSKGQSLFEVVIALAVVTVIIVALVILSTSSIRNSSFSRNRSLATRHSQELAEWLRGERDADWDIFLSRALTFRYCLNELSWNSAVIGTCSQGDTITGTSLQREVVFNIVDPANIEVEVAVYWKDANGNHEVRTITNFTDWRTQ